MVSEKQSIARLAQYRPFHHGGRDSLELIGDLVLAALCEADGRLSSLKVAAEACVSLWGLEIETDELRQVVDGLKSSGRVEIVSGELVLPPGVLAELRLSRRQHEATRQRALREWLDEVARIAPDLTPAELQALESDLDLWLQQVVRRHGVEAALILCPEVPRAQAVMESVEAMGLEFLPSASSAVMRVREQALKQFVRQPTPEQRAYLAALLDTAYFLTLLSMDPESCSLVQTVTSGQSVYIDTNFAYWLLNLSGPRHFLSARRLVELTIGLGYDLRVTPWTVRELRRSLERARTFLSSNPIPPADLAALAAEATTDEDFVTAYWRRLRTHAVSVQDFFEFYSEIELHLEKHGVRVVDDGCTAVDRDQEGIDREVSVFERVLSPRDRALPVKQHDVKHLLLIQRLRGSASRRFASAGFWFLTCDSSLPRYDYESRGGKHEELPFCVTAATWLQCVRAFTPRTEDLDQTLVDLLATPYVRSGRRVSQEAVLEVVARIDLYDGMTPELAARVLLDSALMDDLSGTPDEGSKLQKIDDAVVTAAQEITDKLEESERALQAEREAAAAARARSAESEASVEVLTHELNQARAEVRELSDAARAERSERDAAREELEAAALDLELRRSQEVEELTEAVRAQGQQVRELEEQARLRDERARRRVKNAWMWALFAVAAALFAWFVMTVVRHWQGHLTQAALAASAAFFMFAGVARWRDVKTAALVLGIVGAILTVFAAVYAIL